MTPSFLTGRPAAFFLCLVMTACAARPVSNPFAPEEALHARGLRLLREGRTAGAEKALHDLVVRHPRSIQAHRTYQNLLESRYRHHDAVALYDGYHNRYPQSSNFAYLRGRVAGEQDDQLRYFQRAVELDGQAFWPRYGLGFVLHKAGERDRARFHLEKAARIDPASALPPMILGNIAAGENDFKTARRLWAKASLLDPKDGRPVFRALNAFLIEGEVRRALDLGLGLLPRYVDRPGLCRLLMKILDRIDVRDDFDTVYQAVRKALDKEETPVAHALYGFTAHRLGHLPQARRHYQTALETGVNPMILLNDYRLLLVRLGAYRAAWDLWKTKLPTLKIFTAENKVLHRLEILEKALAAGENTPGKGNVIFALGQALRRAGWIREAREVLRKAVRLKDAPEVKEELELVERHLRFTDELRRMFSAGYRAHFDHETAPSIEDSIARIGRIAAEFVGLNLIKKNRILHFSILGGYLDPSDVEASSLIAYFRRFNQYLLLGRRAGSTTEATLMSMIYLNPKGRTGFVQEPTETEIVLGENFEVGSLGEFTSRDLLGAALFHGYFINVDRLAEKEFDNWQTFLRLLKDSGDLRSYAPLPVELAGDLSVVDDGRGLMELLLLRAYAERLPSEGVSSFGAFKTWRIPEQMRLLFEGTCMHEAMHVVQARRYLPIGSHPMSAFGLALRHGFSGSDIEAELESDSALASLAGSSAPAVELSSIVEFMPYPDAYRPHSRGFYDLVKTLLKYMIRHQETFEKKGVNFRRGLFRQLHKLDGDTLRSMARAIAAERGVFRLVKSAEAPPTKPETPPAKTGPSGKPAGKSGAVPKEAPKTPAAPPTRKAGGKTK